MSTPRSKMPMTFTRALDVGPQDGAVPFRTASGMRSPSEAWDSFERGRARSELDLGLPTTADAANLIITSSVFPTRSSPSSEQQPASPALPPSLAAATAAPPPAAAARRTLAKNAEERYSLHSSHRDGKPARFSSPEEAAAASVLTTGAGVATVLRHLLDQNTGSSTTSPSLAAPSAGSRPSEGNIEPRPSGGGGVCVSPPPPAEGLLLPLAAVRVRRTRRQKAASVESAVPVAVAVRTSSFRMPLQNRTEPTAASICCCVK